MNKNTKIIGSIVVVIAMTLSFYSGIKYGENNIAAASSNRFAGRTGAGGFGGSGTTRADGAGMIGGGTAGDIISKDATSITVGLRDGGSKIIFFSQTTSISSVASGTPSDLIAGKQVTVQGTANQDGSINATFIQVR